MTVVLDASAVVALLRDEPAAGEVESLLHSDTGSILAVNRAEVMAALLRLGVADEPVALALQELQEAEVLQVPLDVPTGDLAGRLRAVHYRKRDSAVSLPDCCALAHAMRTSGRLATCDPALVAAARAEGVEVVALPDSSRRRP